MNIGSAVNAYASLSSQATQRTPESAEINKAGGDNDRDKDDGSSVKSQPSPTVNTSGQQVGQIINVTA